LLVRFGGAIVGGSVNLIACLIARFPAVRKAVVFVDRAGF